MKCTPTLRTVQPKDIVTGKALTLRWLMFRWHVGVLDEVDVVHDDLGGWLTPSASML
jgi:hypothetical protein